MTPEEIDALEAGRKLDEIIADKIFGLAPCDAWKSVNFGSAGGPALVLDSKACSHGKKCYPRYRRGVDFSGAPHYSTDIREAFKILEKLAESWYSTGFTGEDYFCMISRDDIRRGLYIDYGITAPMAICRTAIRIISGDEGFVKGIVQKGDGK